MRMDSAFVLSITLGTPPAELDFVPLIAPHFRDLHMVGLRSKLDRGTVPLEWSRMI